MKGWADDKQRLREELLRRRAALAPEVRQRRSGEAVAHLLSVPEVTGAAVVALYAALSDEIDPGPAIEPLRRAGAIVALPRVRHEQLDLVAIDDVHDLAPGFRGVREPPGSGLDLWDVEAIVVPGVGFDRAGRRLGRGGGHYDRLLATLPDTAVRVGFAFAFQVIDRIPVETHDQPVDVLVTETGSHRTGARADH